MYCDQNVSSIFSPQSPNKGTRKFWQVNCRAYCMFPCKPQENKEFCMPNLGDHNVYLINEEFILSNECCLNLNVDLWQPVSSVYIQDVKTRTWSRENSYKWKGTITFKRAIRREKPESVRCLIPMIRNADTQICFRVGFMDSMTCFSSWNFLFAKHCTRASILLKTCWIVSCLRKQNNIKCHMKH